MITPVTLNFDARIKYTNRQIVDFLSGRNGWSVITNKWPVYNSGIHVIKSPCIGAIMSINDAGYITISAYVGTLVGALNPLSFILYKSEMIDHVKNVSDCVKDMIASNSPNQSLHGSGQRTIPLPINTFSSAP